MFTSVLCDFYLLHKQFSGQKVCNFAGIHVYRRTMFVYHVNLGDSNRSIVENYDLCIELFRNESENYFECEILKI